MLEGCGVAFAFVVAVAVVAAAGLEHSRAGRMGAAVAAGVAGSAAVALGRGGAKVPASSAHTVH